MALRWWKSKDNVREVRSDTFAERLLEQRVAEATGDVTAAALAAIEACASLYARSMAGLDIDAPGWNIEPHELEAVGRSAYRHGQAMLLREGGVSNSWTTYGTGANPAGWSYDVTISSPNDTVTRRRSAREVALIRIGATAATPWRGVSPLQSAAATVALAQRIEASVSAEQNMATGSILAVPTGTPQNQVDALASDLKQLGGRTALVESTRSGWGDGQRAAPQRDWEAQRIGPDVPPSSVQLREQVSQAIYAASGVPGALVGVATGQESREVWRQFVLATIRPLALQLQSELRRSSPSARVSIDSLAADELAQRARAFGSLVKGGMAVAEAVAVSGLLMETEL